MADTSGAARWISALALLGAAVVALLAPNPARAAFGLVSSQSGIGGTAVDFDSANDLVALDPGGIGSPQGVVIYDSAGHAIGGFGDNGADPPDEWTSADDLAVDPADNIWIADTLGDQILEFRLDGTPVRQVGATGSGPGEFRRPVGIAADADGNVYVADSLNDRIQKLSPMGVPLGEWGSFGSGPGQFAHPTGIDVGPGAQVYVTDRYNGRIQQFNADGSFVRAFGTYPPESGAGQLPMPAVIAAGADGSVFVRALGAYSDRDALARFAPDGTLSETFGCPFLGNAGLATAADKLFVAHPGDVGNIKEPPTPPRLETYGDGGAACGRPSTTLRLKARSRQRPRKLEVMVRCPDQPCTVKVTGRVSPKGRRAKGRGFSLHKTVASLGAGERHSVRLRSANPHRLRELAQRKRSSRRRWTVRVRAAATFADTRTAVSETIIHLK